MEMKRFCFIFMMIIFSSFLVNATDTETNDFMGDNLNDRVINEVTNVMNEESRQLQEINGQDNDQIGIKQVTVEEKKIQVLQKMGKMWEFIGTLFLLLFELIKIGFYVVEMYIFLYFIFSLLPNILIKTKSLIVNWYKRKVYD